MRILFVERVLGTLRDPDNRHIRGDDHVYYLFLLIRGRFWQENWLKSVLFWAFDFLLRCTILSLFSHDVLGGGLDCGRADHGICLLLLFCEEVLTWNR